MKRFNRRIICALLGACCLAAYAPARADTYPSRPIHIVVGFAPGAVTDMVARAIGAKLASNLGQSVVIDNRAGAGGTIAADAVAKAAPDGYTILLGEPGSMAINPTLMKLRYDPLKDFAPIAQVINTPIVLVANPSLKATKLADLQALAAHDALSYGSSGTGTILHLSMEVFKSASKLPLVHIPYRGGAPALNDLISGQTPLLIITVPTIAGYIKSGKIVPLGVLGAKRSPLMPQVPTFAEQGYPIATGTPWEGFLAPANTPKEIVARLNSEIRKVMAAPDVSSLLLSVGCEIVVTSPEAFSSLLHEDVALWHKVIQQTDVKLTD